MMRQSVLVFGASGQVGRELVLSAPSNYELVAPASREFDIRDVQSVARVIDRIRPDLVINAAAYTAVDKAESERESAFATNADGAGNVARACSPHATPLIHLSTDYVFDGRRTSAYCEDDPTNPINVYGESKLAGERQIRAARIPGLILRVSWVYGVAGSNFVKTMLRLASQNVVRVVDDQFGTPCAAADIAEAVWRYAARADLREGGRLLHYSSQTANDMVWFRQSDIRNRRCATASRSCSATRSDLDGPIHHQCDPSSNSILDSSQFQRLIGVEAPDWRDSLRRVLLALRESQGGHATA
jgi:dTDP-4-dehydrorhamnose reductase